MARVAPIDIPRHLPSHVRPVKMFFEGRQGLGNAKMPTTLMGFLDQETSNGTRRDTKLALPKEVPSVHKVTIRLTMCQAICINRLKMFITSIQVYYQQKTQ